MSAPLPDALRARFQRLIEEGVSGRAAALRLQLSPATGSRWALAIRQTGCARAGPQAGFTRFSLRGIEKVKAEWQLLTLVYNCKRLATLAGQKQRQSSPRTINPTGCKWITFYFSMLCRIAAWHRISSDRPDLFPLDYFKAA
ncbi:MAG: hypothetical protein ACK5JR_17240 [Tropicimonas sp.]|uniref:hypothetical protein n=1 Tax=Tropicimonas sp. TaxID=2067044 RepID=UPI003A854AB8